MKKNPLAKRIIEISYRQNLSHIGSCLTALPIIEEIYAEKHSDARFVLSCGHAHLAHLVVMEKYGLVNAEEAVNKHGIHCDRIAGCDVSTGSLGMGITIALGMALANRGKSVYVLMSDGEMNEGSVFESLRVAEELDVTNLKIYINANGYAAYRDSDTLFWKRILMQFKRLKIMLILTSVDDIDFLRGLAGHYVTLNEEMYHKALEVIS